MTLQAEDFWSYYEWLMRPDAFLESAFLKGIVLFVLAIVLGLTGRLYRFSRSLRTGRGFLCGSPSDPRFDSLRSSWYVNPSHHCPGKAGV